MEVPVGGVYFDLLETAIAVPLLFVCGYLGYRILKTKQTFLKKIGFLIFLFFLYKLTLFSSIYIISRIFPRWKLIACCNLNQGGCSKRTDCLWVESLSIIGLPSGRACHQRLKGDATAGCPDQIYRLYKILP